MIPIPPKVLGIGGSILAAIFAVGFAYLKGADRAKQECLIQQVKSANIWEEKIQEARKNNILLAEELAKSFTELDKLKDARTKRIVKYVKENINNDTVVFDTDGLSILNDAQKGIITNSE